MRARLAPGVVCAITVVAVAGIGCGGDTIDASAMQAEIKSDFADHVGIAPKAIDCPEQIEATAGKQVRCTGTAPDGSTFNIRVKLTDDDGGFKAVVPPEQFK